MNYEQNFRLKDTFDLRGIAKESFASEMSQSEDPDTKRMDRVHQLPVFDDDITRDTPESTASSTRHLFLRADGSAGCLNTDRLQQNYTDRGGFRTTMRGVVNDIRIEDDDTDGPFSDGQGNNTRSTTHLDQKKASPSKEEPNCCLRGLILMSFLLVLVGAIVVIVIYGKSAAPRREHGKVIQDIEETAPEEHCDEVSVKLGETISVTCKLRTVPPNSPSWFRISPPVYVNKGNNFTVYLDPSKTPSETPGWTGRMVLGTLKMTGPAATCSSDGVYRLHLMDIKNRTAFLSSFFVNVKSEILKVNVSLSQSVTDNQTDFTIGCSTRSGCEQSFVDFFAEINKEEQYLRGVNFSCIIEYNDYDGYSVSCVGHIPDFLMSQFGRITCRPRSRLLDDLDQDEKAELEEVLELPECDLSKHCNYKCEKPGDYFVVNTGRCDIFHRCYQQQVYSSYCAPGTFFDPYKCACRHTTDLAWCQPNGALRPNEEVTKMTCDTTDDIVS